MTEKKEKNNQNKRNGVSNFSENNNNRYVTSNENSKNIINQVFRAKHIYIAQMKKINGYVQIIYGNQQYKTDVSYGSKPTWNTTMIFECNKHENDNNNKNDINDDNDGNMSDGSIILNVKDNILFKLKHMVLLIA